MSKESHESFQLLETIIGIIGKIIPKINDFKQLKLELKEILLPIFKLSVSKTFLFIVKTHFQVDGEQECLKLREKMQEHLAVLQEVKRHLENQKPISSNLEVLKEQLQQLEVSKVFFMLVLQ